jgi:hypothetical protein
MFSFLKNKSIKVKALTSYDNGIHLSFPPETAFTPSWAKNLPTYRSIDIARKVICGEPPPFNVKTCPGRFDLHKKGIMLSLWSDLYLTVGPEKTDEYQYQFADRTSSCESHPYNQYDSMCGENEYLQLKITSPWIFSTDESIDFLALKPAWELKSLQGLEILPGILNFYHQHSTNINMFIKRTKEKQEFLIKAGTPIYHFVPLSDRKVVLESKAVSKGSSEWTSTKKVPFYSFSKRTYKIHRKRK